MLSRCASFRRATAQTPRNVLTSRSSLADGTKILTDSKSATSLENLTSAIETVNGQITETLNDLPEFDGFGGRADVTLDMDTIPDVSDIADAIEPALNGAGADLRFPPPATNVGSVLVKDAAGNVIGEFALDTAGNVVNLLDG